LSALRAERRAALESLALVRMSPRVRALTRCCEVCSSSSKIRSRDGKVMVAEVEVSFMVGV
jgi:hypothetical protein